MKKSKKVRSMGFLLFLAFSIVLSMSRAGAAPINLKVSHWVPPKHVFQRDILEPWAKKITEQTGGQVEFTFYPGGALGKHEDQYAITVRGIADIAMVMQASTPGRFPLTAVMRLPFMSRNSEKGSGALWKLYEKYMKDEYEEVKLLALITAPGAQIHTSKKWVKTLEDMRGMKLRSHGPIVSKDIKALGGVPVTMALPDIYTAVERGTIDGMILPWEVMRPMKFYEVTKFHTESDIYSPTFAMVMNKKKWESLPPDVQKVIDAHIGEALSIEAGRLMDRDDAAGREVCIKEGSQIYQLPEQELKRWKEILEPISREWVEEMEGKGLPGTQVLKEAMEMR